MTVTKQNSLNVIKGSLRGSKVKFKQRQMAKTNSVNMLVLDRHAKVSTVTSSSDLRLRGQRSNKVNFQTTSNDKTNSVNMLAMDKHAKVSTVTSSSDSWLRGQRSKKVKF